MRFIAIGPSVRPSVGGPGGAAVAVVGRRSPVGRSPLRLQGHLLVLGIGTGSTPPTFHGGARSLAMLSLSVCLGLICKVLRVRESRGGLAVPQLAAAPDK